MGRSDDGILVMNIQTYEQTGEPGALERLPANH
jgi:hypothetical protein